MCGICGIVYRDSGRPVDRSVIERMNRTMVHRGPDDEGYFIDEGAALAMRRLSIIDLSGGAQPHFNEDKGIVSVCNGELYNFKELKKNLEEREHRFSSKSDAEIIPHLYEECGTSFVEKIEGMFAIALWDKKNRVLILARDRMGKKPVYWHKSDDAIIFSSELKGIMEYPNISREIDKRALSKYLVYEYVPSPKSIIKNVNKLEPGHLLISEKNKIEVKRYWDIPKSDPKLNMIENEVVLKLRSLLDKAVEKRLMSDVELGVFLSGGIDSSTVAYFAAKHLPEGNLKTFSIGFHEKSFDESSWARQVASFLGTDHHEKFCTPKELMGLLPEISSFLDEPLGDASIVPTYALSKFTREHVTVALGGDGGDELFAGYPTFQAERYLRWYNILPGSVKTLVKNFASYLPVSDKNISLDFKIKQFLKGAQIPGPKKHFYWMGSFSPEELKGLLMSADENDPLDDVDKYALSFDADDGNALLYIYKKLYLQDDILVKVDRASMAASLECRAPLLDQQLVEFVSSLPYGFKLKGSSMKHILKKAMDPLLPRGVAHRSKKGFGIPVAQWFKGPLKDHLMDLLSPKKIKNEGLFNPHYISNLVDEHMSGHADHRKKLWTLFIFQLWHTKKT